MLLLSSPKRGLTGPLGQQFGRFGSFPSQQAGIIPLPEWDRSPVRDAADRYVDATTSSITSRINADPIADRNLLSIDGMLGIEMQPFLAEAASRFCSHN